MDVLAPHDEPVIADWLARRRELGQDGFDEVWDGVYRVAPHESAENGIVASELQALLRAPARAAGLTPGGSFNLGGPSDYRVPDLGFHRGSPRGTYVPTAALVIEVLSPRDLIAAKAAFYAVHGVEELWLVDPRERTVRCRVRDGDDWADTDRSPLLGVVTADLERELDWP